MWRTAMPLKHHNLGSQPAIPEGWDTEARFFKYEYGPLQVRGSSLPQEPTAWSGHDQPLKGVSLGAPPITAAEERDFQIAKARRGKKRVGASLDKIGKKYGL
jgi:hypothetical protein